MTVDVLAAAVAIAFALLGVILRTLWRIQARLSRLEGKVDGRQRSR